MNRPLAALFAAIALTCALPTDAAITATYIGQQNTGASPNDTATPPAITLSGQTAGMFTAVVLNLGFSSPTVLNTPTENGSGGSAWSCTPRYQTTGGAAGSLWVCYTFSLGTGTTTLTFTSNAATPWVVSVAQFTNVTARDATGDSAGTASTTSATTCSTTSGTLAQADELLIGFQTNTGAAITAFTPGTGWTQVGTISAGGVQPISGNTGLQWAWTETAATTAVTWSPTWSPSKAYGCKIFAFKATGGGTPTPSKGVGLLMGVGE